MRFLLRLVFVLILFAFIALPLAAIALAWAMVSDTPLIAKPAEIRPENIARAKRIMERNDPRRMRPGMLGGIVVSAPDLDLAANYAAQQFLKGTASVQLQPGLMTVRASLPLPPNPLGRWVNVDATLAEGAGLPRVESLTIGRVTVPAPIAGMAMRRAIAYWEERSGLPSAASAVRRVSLRDNAMMVVYEWNDQLPERLRALLTSPEDEARFKAYQSRLAQVAEEGGGRPLPLERCLGALLALAAERGGDAAAENRAAIVTLAFFVNGRGLKAILPAARHWPVPAPRQVTLGGRHDFAQHYSISAAIAAAAGSPLADAVGLYKEIEDSKGGSGFSFNDIAADRAGTRLGEFAVASVSARRLQERGRTLEASDILPEVADLPEFMQETEFRKRYGGVGGPEYRRMMASIEARVAGLAILR
jgi:hypothetical protein